MRIILTGGGTAGHVNPALAIAEEIILREGSPEILFVGRAGGGENKVVEERGINTKYLDVHGIERRLTVKNLKNILLAIKARRKAEIIIKDFMPDIVVGTGGYVCWPVIRAAQRLGIPTAIHESNVYPGLTTRLLSGKCDAVLLNHGRTRELLPKSCMSVTVGNPLRSDFFTTDRKTARRALGLCDNDIFIVSFGGSIGAEVLNGAVISAMDSYSRKKKNIKHLHALGKRYYDKSDRADLIRGCDGCRLLPFIDNMPRILPAADIVISRCGAMTLSELALVGVAAILVPSPNVTDNHQYKNAKHLVDNGAALMLEESELSCDSLVEKIRTLRENPGLRASLSEKIKKFAVTDSRERIYSVLTRIANKK